MCEMYVGGAVAVGLFKGFCLFGMLQHMSFEP